MEEDLNLHHEPKVLGGGAEIDGATIGGLTQRKGCGLVVWEALDIC